MSGGGKGGKSQPTTATTSTQTSIPDWLSGAAQQAVGMGQDLATRPYQQYQGQVLADPNADTLQAYQQVRDMQGQTAPAFQQASNVYQGLLGQAGPLTTQGINQNTSGLFGNYQANVMNPAQQLLGGYASQGPATAQQVASGAQTIMNPYTQSVIDPTLAAGEQARQMARQQVAGQAQNVGAFGGSRQGVAEGVSDAQTLLGTQQQIGNMLTGGWNAALSPATQVALQGGQQGLAASQYLAGLGQQGYNAAATQGANMAQINQAQGMTALGAIPNLAVQQQAQAQKDASMLQTIGAAQQQQAQAGLNVPYSQWQEQQAWPVQNLDILLSAVSGVPYGTSSTGTSTPSYTPQSKNMAAGIMGGAASGAALGGTLFPGVGALPGAAVGGILGAL